MKSYVSDDFILGEALIEDLGFPFKDITTELLFSTSLNGKAEIRSKHSEPVVVCGIEVVRQIFSKLNTDKSLALETDYKDGDILNPGQTLLTLEAPAAILLKGERTALNFLRHLSAISTLTARYVEKVKHTSLKILDTRKTTPGLRQMEKYAVHCGGGVNHRMGLYDAIMIKDTHVDMLGGIEIAINSLPFLSAHHLPVIVEVRSMEELAIVLDKGKDKVTRALLDNMPLEMLRICVLQCENIVETEASGNIRLETIQAIAETGVQYASIGELTYGAGQVDLSMYTFRK